MFLSAAIVLAVYVVTNVLFASDLALLTAGAFVVVFAGLWYILPMTWRSTSSEEEGSSDDQPQEESRGASSRR